MNNFKIITLVLTSSVFSAVLTSTVNWFLQKANYRTDYYKKILDKRLQSYEIAHKILSILTSNDQLPDGKICLEIFARGKNTYHDFYRQLLSAKDVSFWLSDDLTNKLSELNYFLLNNIDSKVNQATFDSDLLELGLKHGASIKKIRADLENILYADLFSLHKVEKFLNRKPKKTTSRRLS